MNRRKWTVMVCAVLAASLAGCGTAYQEKAQAGVAYYRKAAHAESAAREAMTITLRVTEVDGTAIRGCAGSAEDGAFTESGLTVTFTLAEDAVITVECRQGNGEGTVEDIEAGAVLQVTLDEKYQAVAIAVKKPDTGSSAGENGDIS